jgi:GntP family gluconate:H+ symporter
MEAVQISFTHLLLALIGSIAVIILLTAKYKLHAFYALLIACFVVGISVGMPVDRILDHAKSGFGHVMKSLAFLIVLGTALGVLLERSGSTHVMADWILKRTGEKKSPIAMAITGFVVGLPIFCDSGYIVLSGLANSLAKRTGISVAILAGALATGLYSVHCLIPPHPGMSAAGAQLNVDFGRLIAVGILVAIPSSVAGYLWTSFAGKRWEAKTAPSEHQTEEVRPFGKPGVIMAFAPVIIPIVLIALKPFLTNQTDAQTLITAFISVVGEPSIALTTGILLTLFNFRSKEDKKRITGSLSDAAEKAGGILVIIGAGGAFGAILAATNPGAHFSSIAAGGSLGLFFPFLVTFVLKTAQGSSTVAIITAASLTYPLLPALQLDGENGALLAALSMGAGSMMISHANDAYFWVIARFSGLEMNTMLRVYTVASVVMGLTALLGVYALSFVL